MGEYDAGGSGRVDRPTVAEMMEFSGMPETVTPEGLRARADIMRAADPSCARHLELAAEEIQKLRRQGDQKAVEDGDRLQGTRYVTATNAKLRAATFTLYRHDDILGFMIFDAEQTYDFGNHFVRLYDKLEGLE